MRCRCRDRRGFTLVELVVVVMILGILAAIAAPRMLRTSDRAIDNGVRQTLNVIRDAIDHFAAAHGGQLPGIDAQQETFKSNIAPYMRGTVFPKCPVGAALNNEVIMVAGLEPGPLGVDSSEATHSWGYKYETGEFYCNSLAVSTDGVTLYCEF